LVVAVTDPAARVDADRGSESDAAVEAFWGKPNGRARTSTAVGPPARTAPIEARAGDGALPGRGRYRRHAPWQTVSNRRRIAALGQRIVAR